VKISEIRKLKKDEFDKKLSELRMELIKLKGQASTGTPPKSPGQISMLKRTIARFNTVARPNESAVQVKKQTEEKKS